MTIDKKNHKSALSNDQAPEKSQHADTQQKSNAPLSRQRSGEQPNVLPIKQVKRRFFVLLALALVLIAVLIWLTLAVMEANDIEPFGELAALAPFIDVA